MISSSPQIGQWVAEKTDGVYRPNSVSLGLISHEKVVAGVVYDTWNGVSIHASIAIEGIMTPRYLAAIFHYPFIHVGAKKIICSVAEKNYNSLRLVQKLGFRLEAQILDAHPDGSLLIFTMNREQCRFIGADKYGQVSKNAAAN